MSIFKIGPQCVFCKKGIGAEKTNVYKAKNEKILVSRPQRANGSFAHYKVDIFVNGDVVIMLEKCTVELIDINGLRENAKVAKQ